MTRSYGLDLPDQLYDAIEAAREKGEPKNHWIYRAIRRSLAIEEKADAHGEDLPEGWWDEGLDRYLEWRRTHPEEREPVGGGQDREREEIEA